MTTRFENTPISFPIAFTRAVIYGAEARLDLPDWNGFSGYLSYSYQLANAWNPVTGGTLSRCDFDTGRRPFSRFRGPAQHSSRAVSTIRSHRGPRLLVEYGLTAGLPFEFHCDPSLTLDQCIQGQVQIYGGQVVKRINFARGRIYHTFQISASLGADIHNSDRLKMKFQLDGQNLTNVGRRYGLWWPVFGERHSPSRSFSLRVTTNF